MTAVDPSTGLMQMINCYQVSQALHVAATLGVADQTEGWAKALRCRGANMWGASSVTLSIAPGTGRGRCISRDEQQRVLAHSIGCLPDERCAWLPVPLRTMDRNTRPVEILG